MSSSKTAAVVPQNQNSVLPMWMRQSIEHLSMKTNMEEYGTSPPECESLFLHEGNFPCYQIPKYSRPDPVSTTAASQSLIFKAKDLVPRGSRSLTVAPLVGDQVCPSSAPQSAATTPSVSPQQSPTLIRKILSADSHCKAGPVAAEGTRKARIVPVTRVTNFDLNAVSPTSW